MWAGTRVKGQQFITFLVTGLWQGQVAYSVLKGKASHKDMLDYEARVGCLEPLPKMATTAAARTTKCLEGLEWKFNSARQ